MVGKVTVCEGATGEVEEMAALSVMLDSAVTQASGGKAGLRCMVPEGLRLVIVLY